MKLKIFFHHLIEDDSQRDKIKPNLLVTGADKKYYINLTDSVEEEFLLKTEPGITSFARLKILFSTKKTIPPDCLHFFKLEYSQLKEIPDIENIQTLLDSNKNLTSNKDITSLYYYVSDDNRVKVYIDFYLLNIEKIFLTLSLNCSIILLKTIISNKLSNKITEESQKIFGLNVINNSTKQKIQFTHTKELQNFTKLLDIHNFYSKLEQSKNKNNSSLISTVDSKDYSKIPIKYSLHFLLVHQSDKKTNIGLNFKFNFFRNFHKINYNVFAPNYCECSDGLNLFCYCRNPACSIYNNLFVKELGYGFFDVKKEIDRTSCPKCSSVELTEPRNIGLINSKWFYRVILNTQKYTLLEGDGITIDKKLYILQEAKLKTFLYKMVMDVQENFQKEGKAINDLQYTNGVQEDEDLQSIIDEDASKRKMNNSSLSQFILKDNKYSECYSKKSGVGELNTNNDIKTTQYEFVNNGNSPKSSKVPLILNEIKKNPGVKFVENGDIDSLNVLLENKQHTSCASCIIGNNNLDNDTCQIF